MFKPSLKFGILLYVKQNGKCFYCQCEIAKECENGGRPHIDHKVPQSKGGTDEEENLALTCSFCNGSKMTKSVAEFLAYLEPVLEGKCSKKDLREYNLWRKLNTKYVPREEKI